MRLSSLLRPPIDPERTTIEDFVRQQAEKVPAGSVVLDAGAGDRPYRHYFQHTAYRALDFAGTSYHTFNEIDIVSDLAAIPLPAESVDVILCTQVLEHVPRPGRVLTELARVLKPGGRLLLTVPQSWELHESPHDYFRFTRYGLAVPTR